MPVFNYTGRDLTGRKVKGRLDRSTPSDVARYLSQQAITPVQITPAAVAFYHCGAAAVWTSYFQAKSMGCDDLMMLCRQLSTISKSGVPLIQGVQSLAATADKKIMRDTLQTVAKRLESGISLANALGEHRRVFNDLLINLVRVGEHTGKLDQVFLQLARYFERDARTQKSLNTALRYPGFVVLAMLVAMVVVNGLVMPAFVDFFQRFTTDLPWVTRLFIYTSDIFIHYGWVLVLGFFTAVTAFFYWLTTLAGKMCWGKIRLKLPLVGGLIYQAAIARYLHAFALMLSAGVPLVSAIALSAGVLDNAYLSAKITQIQAGVEHGDSLYRTHGRSGLLTPLALQMLNIGEQSGEVDRLLAEVAAFYDAEVDYGLSSLTAKIEPLLILLMAVFVLLLALGIFLPLWTLYTLQF
ncbi:MAG: type II secretion system F family protein [Cellvibrionaceae bacterium]|nr:type II secretion system F family protein [Cellvibrionaceae bacterium]